MKRNAKQSGTGGRLRLGLLLATAAAFLLVPAAGAAANPPLKVNIVAQPGASGEVTSDETVTGIPEFEGTPQIECNYPVGGPKEGVCENEMAFLPGEGYLVALNAIPGPESKVGKWEVSEPGLPATACGEGAKLCVPATPSETEPITVTVEFENEVTELHLDIVGIEGGGGSVKSPSKVALIPGTPAIECSLPEGGEQEGVCTNEMEEVEPGAFAVGLEIAGGGPNSEFVEWEVAAPGIEAGGCGENTFCTPASAGGDVTVTVTFECEAGKECPEPEPEFPLSVECTGSGSGSVSPVDCGESAEYENGTEVTLSASADTGSEFTGWTGCESEPEPNECVVTIAEPGNEVTANFEPETFALTLTPIGEGTLEAECGGGACASLTEIPYGTEVDVTAEPNSIEFVLATITGAGSAASSCSVGSESCSFEMKATSSVEAEFVLGSGQATGPANVHGFVPQTTTLEFPEDGEGDTCEDVDLGIFLPNAQEDKTYAKTCGLIVTSTGAESTLVASDDSEEEAGRLGHLVQPSYALDEPLETQATDNDELGGISGTGEVLAPLTAPVTLLSYGVPVNFDHVTLEFSQLIKEHDPLHTGEYAKEITLTLKQTA